MNLITPLERAAAGHELPGLTQQELRAEIRSNNIQVLAGFSFADCEPVSASGYAKALTGRGRTIGQVATKDVRVVFKFVGAELFAIDFLPQTFH